MIDCYVNTVERGDYHITLKRYRSARISDGVRAFRAGVELLSFVRHLEESKRLTVTRIMLEAEGRSVTFKNLFRGDLDRDMAIGLVRKLMKMRTLEEDRNLFNQEIALYTRKGENNGN